MESTLRRVSQRRHAAADRTRGDARRGVRDASRRSLEGEARMPPAVAAGLALALASALALDVGFLIQQGAVAGASPLSLRRPVTWVRALLGSRRWIAGFVLGLGGWALYFAALALAPLSLVQTVAASAIGLLVLLTAIGAQALPGRRAGIGAVLATLGLMALTISVERSGATTS